MRSVFVAILAASMLGGCAAKTPPPKAHPIRINEDPYPSTYTRYPGAVTVIRGATVFDGEGGRIERGTVIFGDGLLQAVGDASLASPAGAIEIDGTGKFVTPGIIDVHSHLGDYPSPGTASLQDGNEATGPVRPEVWAEHSVWPQDPGFSRALANGGITTLQVLPGSANLFGGRSVVLKNVHARTVQGMKFPGAPYGLKMACGENPKRVYGNKGGPGTRMGNIAVTRATWLRAQDYKRKWDKYDKNGGDMPGRDLAMDTLRGVLDGKILIHNHCYRADEMAIMIDMSKEFGYKITAFHHAVEAYKIADLLAANNICAAMWADWYGFKMESYDAVKENIPLVHNAGACAIVHSDDANGIQRLNQEAAKALADGIRAGIPGLSEAVAWEWLSRNPAKALGILDRTGSLKVGKMADVVLWNGNPLSGYTRPERVWIDGAEMYDSANPNKRPVSDFELGQPGEGDTK
ncbi:MAG: amidohydrolase [Sphingomicrobium sp.]